MLKDMGKMPAAEAWCSILQEDISLVVQQERICQRPCRGYIMQEKKAQENIQEKKQTVCSVFIPT